MQAVIEFLALAMGVDPRTVSRWRHRRVVPHKYRLPIAAAAERAGLTLDPEAFDNLASPDMSWPSDLPAALRHSMVRLGDKPSLGCGCHRPREVASP